MSRRSALLVTGFASLFLIACGGGGFGDFNPPPVATNTDFARDGSGEKVLIVTDHPFIHAKKVLIGSREATIVEESSNSVRVVVPADSGNTSIQVFDGPDFITSIFLEALPSIDVVEVEPNDSTTGSNATSAGRNHMAHGTLANVTDKDHFKFDEMSGNIRYEITVSQAVSVFVNGTSVPLDGTGKGSFTAHTGTNLVGITGGIGAYSFTMRGILPTP